MPILNEIKLLFESHPTNKVCRKDLDWKPRAFSTWKGTLNGGIQESRLSWRGLKKLNPKGCMYLFIGEVLFRPYARPPIPQLHNKLIYIIGILICGIEKLPQKQTTKVYNL